eukprot:CCRYP_002653-RB/>CCRYP_002653-RB protein AED:0.44 eAED:0.44 QI:3/-1/1/1/-1/0/1/10/110
MNKVFANRNEEDSIYPHTIEEIAEAQQDNESLHDKGYTTQLVENTNVLCKDSKMVIPKSLQHLAVAWFHRYLQHQHPGTKRLEETLLFRCIGEVYKRQSNHMSKSVIVAR